MEVNKSIKARIKNNVTDLRIHGVDWMPIQVLADDLEMSIEMIEAYLSTGQLVASFFCSNGATLLSEVDLENNGEMEWVVSSCKEPDFAIKGIYDIVSYREIKWKDNEVIKEKTSDLNAHNIFLYRDNKYYSIACKYTINKNDLIITRINIDTFKHRLDGSDIPCGDQLPNIVAPYEPIAEVEQRPEKTTESGRPKHTVSAKGNRGFLKALILGSLQDFYVSKYNIPEGGNAFKNFLNFIIDSLKSKPRPEYLVKVSEIKRASAPDEKCICEKKGKDMTHWHKRKYVEDRFYEFRKENPHV